MFYFHPRVCFIDALCVEAGSINCNIAQYPGADEIMRVSQQVKRKTHRETIKDLIVGAHGGMRIPRKHRGCGYYDEEHIRREMGNSY